MADFEDLDAASEAPETLGKLASIKVNWDKKDVEGWFMELEMQMEILNIKTQWVKRIILGNNIPETVKAEVKDLLKVKKSQLTDENKLIYKVLKTKILKLFGKREGENYDEACAMLLTSEMKPSALCKRLTETLCKCSPQLQCCVADVVASLWKKQLPPTVRANIAGRSLRDDFDGTLTQADDVYASLRTQQVAAAAVTDEADQEIAALHRGGAGSQRARGNRGNYNYNYRGGGAGRGRGWNGRGNSRGGRAGHQGQARRDGEQPPEGVCGRHKRWGKQAWFCSNISQCPWKDFTVQPPQE